MTYNVTITDSGARVSSTIEAADIEAACELMEKSMKEAEQVTAGNPGCEPRTEWICFVLAGYYAECSLRSEGEQDAACWTKVTIEEVR
jgi:hypothetical protein